MPNHITNRIKLIGEPAEVRRVMEAVKVDKVGLGSLDFEKVIPMPDDVEDSYNWCIDNWDTKWNSYGYENFEAAENTDTISFLTAWSAPHTILEKLTTMFPTITFEHEWADEDIGCNCGRRTYYDGERTEEYYPNCGREGTEFAASVIGLDLGEDCSLYLNASETDYVHIESLDGDLQQIELFGKPALFTNARITDADIPKGMYCYHLRHGDEGYFCTIEKRVAVNHAGSVITKEPIDLGTEGYISFTDDTSPNFIDNMTLSEFMEYEPELSEDEAFEMEVPQ